MKKLLRLTASTLVLGLALSVTSYGWSDTGHMAVAYVAYRNLTPQTRAHVDHLITLNPRFHLWSTTRIPQGTPAAKRRLMLFMIAATWADQIKSDGVHHADGSNNGDSPPHDGTAGQNIGYQDTAMHKYWHFIDKPFSPDNTPLENPEEPNAETQIAIFRSVLASNSPDALKSYDLVWLLHLVGDVHQPLHATSRFTHNQIHGDAGGNFVRLTGQPNKLHSFWDGLLGTSRDPAVAISVGQGLSAAPANLANDLDASVWINESFQAAQTVTYHQPPIGIGAGPFTPTNAYRNTARALARKRVALAGARLANILNNELR
jgi:hypothetical protein